jgi:hypothetical protein
MQLGQHDNDLHCARCSAHQALLGGLPVKHNTCNVLNCDEGQKPEISPTEEVSMIGLLFSPYSDQGDIV